MSMSPAPEFRQYPGFHGAPESRAKIYAAPGGLRLICWVAIVSGWLGLVLGVIGLVLQVAEPPHGGRRDQELIAQLPKPAQPIFQELRHDLTNLFMSHQVAALLCGGAAMLVSLASITYGRRCLALQSGARGALIVTMIAVIVVNGLQLYVGQRLKADVDQALSKTEQRVEALELQWRSYGAAMPARLDRSPGWLGRRSAFELVMAVMVVFLVAEIIYALLAILYLCQRPIERLFDSAAKV